MKVKFLVLIALWWVAESSATVLKVSAKGPTSDVAKIASIVPGVQKVINSPEFKERVLKAKFTTTKDSNETILKKILIPEWSLSYEFKMNRSWTGRCPVLGWTYPNVKTVWFNTCNFKSRNDSGIAGTICHEQLHKLGYDHKSEKDLLSVPYSVGNICSELYGKTN